MLGNKQISNTQRRVCGIQRCFPAISHRNNTIFNLGDASAFKFDLKMLFKKKDKDTL